jgi:hypothetical protein
MKTEEKVAHTKGPWKAVAVDESAEYKQWEIQPHVGVVERVDGIGEANARLIAAAPMMYDYIAVKAELGDTEAGKIMEAVRGST